MHHVIKSSRPSPSEKTPTHNKHVRSMRAWRREKASIRGYVTSRIAAAPVRFLNVILTSFCHVITNYARESEGKRLMAGAAKRIDLAAKEAAWNLGYEDAKACQLDFIAGVVTGRKILKKATFQ